MKPRPRLLRVTKWTGVAICILILATAIVSARFEIVWRSGHPNRHSGYANAPGGSVQVGVGQGMIRIVRNPPAAPWFLNNELLMRQMVQLDSRNPRYVNPGWTVTRHTTPLRWWPRSTGVYRTMQMRFADRDTNAKYQTSAVELAIPIWLPLALAAALTALLFWRGRRLRFQPGHCPCGYNLTGNVSGTCPECGRPFEPKGDAI